METAPRAGKSWQPCHEPHTEGKMGTCHTDNTVEREGVKGGTALEKCFHTQEMLTT